MRRRADGREIFEQELAAKFLNEQDNQLSASKPPTGCAAKLNPPLSDLDNERLSEYKTFRAIRP